MNRPRLGWVACSLAILTAIAGGGCESEDETGPGARRGGDRGGAADSSPAPGARGPDAAAAIPSGGATATADPDAAASPFSCTPRTTGFVTDRATRSAAPLALPAAGSNFVDPAFGTTIVRITDAQDGDDCVNAYSYWPTFNLTSTRLHLRCEDGPHVYDFSPTTLAVSGKRPLFAAPPAPGGALPGWEDAIWSGREPDVIFAHEAQRIWRYDVATATYQLVRDLEPELGPGFIRQISKSIDDDTFGFTRQDSSYNVLGYAVYRRSTNRILLNVDRPTVDEVQIDKSGRFLIVKTGEQGAGKIEVRVCDVDAGTCEDLTDDGPDFAPGHSDLGHGTVVGADNWNNSYTFRRLDTPHVRSTVLSFGSDWDIGSHLSMLADDESWALLSTFVGPSAAPAPLRGELVLFATDGSERMRRIAHVRSTYREYFDSPRATISRDGCFVTFTSNWGASRRDVFVASLK